jgi:hypothetical protein
MASDSTTSRLLALPDPCLLAVMQCCADDTRSMISAATAHSRLQRAAGAALSRVTARKLRKDPVDSLLRYLAKHGQHVRSLDLCASENNMQLLELPPSLTKLASLQLEGMTLQLQPGVLRAGLPLTRLEFSECTLLDGTQGLSSALVQLPDLQHLRVDTVYDDPHETALQVIPTAVLSQLTNLTSLTLSAEGSSSDVSAALGSLRALTRLVDLVLNLGCLHPCRVDADMLSSAAPAAV